MRSYLSRKARGALAALAATATVAVMAAAPGSAQAYQQIYCRTYVAALDVCSSSGLHSWYFNSAATDSGQTVCVYMWNAHNQVRRGNDRPCGYGYIDQVYNRTNDPWYNAKSVNGTYGVAIYIVGNAIA